MANASPTTQRGTSSQVRSIVLAGLVIGIVSGLDQTTFFVLTLHYTPVSVFQYIASGLLGSAAFAGGYATALLGLLIHFAISFTVAAVFILTASRIATLRRTVFLSALVYGAAVNFVMTAVVLPLSAAPKLPMTTVFVVHGFIADALFIGLPIAVAVWRQGVRTTTKVSVPV